MSHFKLSALLALCMFTGVLITGCGHDNDNPQKSAGQPSKKSSGTAPAFKLPELAGGKLMDFPAGFKGKKIALVFFSTG